MKFKLSDAGIAAVRLLEALDASADFNPIVKSVAGGALHFAKLVENYHSDKKAWSQFAEHVQKSVALVAQSIADQGVDTTRLRKDLDELNKVLDEMCSEIAQKQHQGTAKRVFAFIKDPKQIEDMQKRFDRAIQLFHLGADIYIGQDVAKVLQAIQKKTATLDTVVHGVQKSMLIATLARLPYAQGATWNPDRMCLPETRVSILDQIMQWLGDFKGNMDKRIFCLTGAPGAGKSAIAHSISARCAKAGWLATAFFFNREDSTRSALLFSTIVCDLAARFSSFQASVSQAIENDPSLSAAGASRIFDGLIIPFAVGLPQDKPIVIVLDALDEGLTKGDLDILMDRIINLPHVVKLFVTSRDVESFRQLFEATHVHQRKFVHHGGQEQGDVRLVAKTCLDAVAVAKRLKDFPTEEIVEMVAKRSQGLMIWVVTICQYLEQVPDPQSDLLDLVNRVQPDDQGMEEKMDNLYAMLLLGFPWKNKRFVNGYGQVMGTILASKVPLSEQAIDALNHGIPKLSTLLQTFKPLLLPSNEGNPIQILHQSLHDLLADRAHANQEWKLFSVDEDVQNQRLALHCLQVINNELSESTPGTGYLHGEETGVPIVTEHLIPEHLKYACRFWVDHLICDKKPSEEITQALQDFFSNKFSLWLEVTTCIGPIINLNSLITWSNDIVPNLNYKLFTWTVANAWRSITYKLVQENRRNEALTAAELSCMLIPNYTDGDDVAKGNHIEALSALSWAQSQMGKRVEALQNARECHTISRLLAEKDSVKFNPDLARSLRNLANRLSDMGLREEALQASTDAVEIYKELAEKNPSLFNPDLARALGNLSIMLSNMGLREEALQKNREVVGMYKELVKKNQTLFNPNLAMALDNLAIKFSVMGLREEALEASRDAVDMYKELAEKNAASFNPDLARAVDNLAIMLSNMGSREEALQTSREAVDMYKELAEKNPAPFNPNLAMAMDTLANMLSNMGLREEALQTSREAVSMYKVLAENNPDSFNPDLARALDNLGLKLSGMRLSEEALQASRDAVRMKRDLVEKNSASFNPDLASTLDNLANRLSDMGLREEALQTSREAVDIYKLLVENNPASFKPDLARALDSLGLKLSGMGLREEALQVSRDAVDMYKELAEKNPAAFNPDLARTLDNLTTRLSSMGLREEALQASRDAVCMYKELAEKNRSAFNPDLARVLHNLAIRLSENTLMEESLEASRIAIQMRRDLAKNNLNAFIEDLADSLYNYSIYLSEFGLKDVALEVAKETLAIRNDLVMRHPNNIILQKDLIDSQKLLSGLEDK
ncbi:TPR-like protein [Schizopora paradoxa]|uniref:TPR-like protein n=1 Tax=Schizopora paradoxa TaxID=27342 RepID=A0A0H2RQS9_9AGAM|nr:TPR-like protein [Schizopora paradoxa]